MTEPLPPVGPAPLVEMSLTGPLSIRPVRQAIEAIAHNLGWDRSAVNGLLLVVNEVALTSLAHGRGDRRVQVWVERAAITCEVTDDGDGPADPLAGYRPPETPREAGVGLWIANQFSDWLAIEHRDGATRCDSGAAGDPGPVPPITRGRGAAWTSPHSHVIGRASPRCSARNAGH